MLFPSRPPAIFCTSSSSIIAEKHFEARHTNVSQMGKSFCCPIWLTLKMTSQVHTESLMAYLAIADDRPVKLVEIIVCVYFSKPLKARQWALLLVVDVFRWLSAQIVGLPPSSARNQIDATRHTSKIPINYFDGFWLCEEAKKQANEFWSFMTERLLEMARMKGKSIIIRWAREIAEKKEDVSFMSMAKQKKKIVEIIDRLILRAAAGAWTIV